MSTITIENNHISIPVEMVTREGMAILTIAPNAHLILPGDALANYSPEILQRIAQAVQVIQSPAPAYHLYSPRKARMMKELRERGMTNISGGEEYGLKPSSISLEQVQQELSTIKGSLADDIIDMRDEE